MNEQSVSSLSEFLKYIELLKSNYPTGIMFNNPAFDVFLYRGLPDTEFELVPKVLRKDYAYLGEQVIENNQYKAWATEKIILKEYIREGMRYKDLSPTDYVHWAEYAQHYGAPTRFLDWTGNPTVALYFACKENLEKDGIVWILHRINYEEEWARLVQNKKDVLVEDLISELITSESGVEYPILYAPYYVDERMSAQNSHFMVWGSREDSLETMFSDVKYAMEMPPENSTSRIRGSRQKENLLFKFIIQADRKASIIRELDTIGINERFLFPGMDGLGKYIDRRFKFSYTEAMNNL